MFKNPGSGVDKHGPGSPSLTLPPLTKQSITRILVVMERGGNCGGGSQPKNIIN